MAAAGSPSSEPKLPEPVDERHAQREGLRHAHERVVDRGVAVRVVVAHHVADDRGALACFASAKRRCLPHRVEDAALDRLQAVAHVGQRAARDDRQRVVQVPRLCDVVERRDLLGIRGEEVDLIASSRALLLRAARSGARPALGRARAACLRCFLAGQDSTPSKSRRALQPVVRFEPFAEVTTDERRMSIFGVNKCQARGLSVAPR